MSSKATSSALPEQTAFDRRRAASSLGCTSDHSYKTLFFQAIYQQQADIVRSLPADQIVSFVDSLDGTGRTPLIHSVSLGDVNTCKLLLQLGCDISKRDDTTWTALHHAAEGGSEDIFKLLLNNKANPDCRTRQKYTPLHIATYNERIGIISILQSMDIRINSQDIKGRTPLNLAIEEGVAWKTIKILLDMGADPNIQNKRDEHPVLLAAILGKFKIANKIIEHSKIPFRQSSYNLRDLKGRSILHAAVEKRMSFEIFTTFSRGVFDLNLVNSQGKSPLLVAIELGYVHIAEELIIAGANINQRDPCGKTPLYVAAREGHEGIILALFERGTPVSYCQDPFLPTALHVAVFKEHEESLITALLLSEDELELRNIFGQTPLLFAMYRNNAHAVNVLVKSEAKVDVADIDGDTPIEILRRSVNLKLFAAYAGELDSYEAGETEKILQFGIKNNMVEYVEALLQNGAVVYHYHLEAAIGHERGHEGGKRENTIPKMLLKYMMLSKRKHTRTVRFFIFEAVTRNNVKMINNIIQSGIIDPNQETFILKEPLIYAIQCGQLEAAEALLKAGCDPTYDIEDKDEIEWVLAQNQSMKDLCSKYGLRMETKEELAFSDMTATSLMEHVKEIISSGKGLLDFDPHGETVLHRAASLGDLEILKLIIKNGIDINVQNHFDETALHIAANKYFVNVVEFLLANGADLNIKDSINETPLGLIVKGFNFELSLKLLDAGATAIVIDKKFLQRVARSGNVRILDELRIRNITPNLMARDIYDIILLIDKQSKKEMLEYFINVFRDGDENGDNALFGALFAAFDHGKLNLIQDILQLDPSLVNSVNEKTGESVLHVGLDVFKGKEFLRLLLVVEEFGGDLDKVCNKKNQTPLEKCIRNKRLVEAALLVSMKADCTQYAVSLAYSTKQDDLVQMMVDAGATPPPHWPKRVLSLLKLTTIACRKYIPQKGFRMGIKSLKLGPFQASGLYNDILLLENHCQIIKKAKQSYLLD